RASPGDTLFGADGDAHWSLVVDVDGEVVWAWRHDTRVMELQLTDEGVLLGVPERDGGPFEVDWTGRYRRRFLPADRADADAIPVDVRLFHHDAQPMSDGRVLALTNDRVEAPSYPVSYQSPTLVAEDEPVRLDRAIVVGPDGTVLESYPLDDHIPLTRIGYDSLDGEGRERNWTHTNGVIEHGDTLLISARNQDTLVAVDRLTGTTRWILANPANWPPDREALRLKASGEIRWPYHQHAPEWNGDEILVFDNGNHQASPWTGERDLPATEVETRVAAYTIDEDAGTVSEAWSFVHPDHRFFCPYLGDADRLPGGTVLADYANVTKVDGAPTADLGRGGSLARLVEFEPETGDVVWDLEVRGHLGEKGWSSFRAQRIATDWVAGAW
ncbi:MAG: aryl-sulfate sulfotransferase, partial [Myxococcales bacterium]|nr:aryl-sulfate sulfotransferase [Myxococcales bacterium]